MTDGSHASPLTLKQLDLCFKGFIPSSIATCSADGVPNVSYISHVCLVDDEHVAISYQFFNTTRRNILSNPQVAIRVRDPRNMQPYILRAKYLRSEYEGQIFDSMNLRLKVIASYEGMSDVYALKAADIYRVTSIEKVEQFTTLDIPLSVSEDKFACTASDLESLRVVSERLARCCNIAELMDRSLSLLDQFFNFRYMILMLADEENGVLLTHASHGYGTAGIGSEIRWGDGLIGKVAEYRRVLHLTAVDSGLRYARSVRQSAVGIGADVISREVPLPGLKNPTDQIALPMISGKRLIGVLAAETDSAQEFGIREQNILSIVTNQLAGEIARFAASDMESEVSVVSAAGSSETVAVDAKDCGKLPLKSFVFVKNDDSLFIDNEYLIKNVPARIFWYLLKTFLATGRREFSNRELRAESWFQLPELKDNLESRLILLRNRLKEKCPGVTLRSTGRGKFLLDLCVRIELTEKE